MESIAENVFAGQNRPRRFEPKLAMCNFIPEIEKLGEFARQHGFTGIDYSFDLENLGFHRIFGAAIGKLTG